MRKNENPATPKRETPFQVKGKITQKTRAREEGAGDWGNHKRGGGESSGWSIHALHPENYRKKGQIAESYELPSIGDFGKEGNTMTGKGDEH